MADSTEPLVERDEEIDLDRTLEPLHKVIVHNDDITPYDFVMTVLMRFFKLTSKDAEAVTWKANTSGLALVAVLPLSEAQKRVGQAHFAATLEGYPLTFTIEEE